MVGLADLLGGEVSPDLSPLQQRMDEIERRATLRTVLGRAREKSPETFSEAVDLSQRTGLPSGDVEDQIKTVRDRVDEAPDALAIHAPITAQALIDDPDLAGAAHDSIKDLTGLEWLFAAPKAAFEQGEVQLQLSELRYNQILGRASLVDIARADQLSASLGADLGAEGWWENAAVEFPKMLPISLEVLGEGIEQGIAGGLGFGTGALIVGNASPLIALPEEIFTLPAAFGAGYFVASRPAALRKAARIEAGLAYDEFLGIRGEDGQPLEEDVAKAAALVAGGINGVLEIAGLSTVL